VVAASTVSGRGLFIKSLGDVMRQRAIRVPLGEVKLGVPDPNV
jgi:hypothetical protein